MLAGIMAAVAHVGREVRNPIMTDQGPVPVGGKKRSGGSARRSKSLHRLRGQARLDFIWKSMARANYLHRIHRAAQLERRQALTLQS